MIMRVGVRVSRVGDEGNKNDGYGKRNGLC